MPEPTKIQSVLTMRDHYLAERGQMEARIAKIDRALEGLVALIDLVTEDEGGKPPVKEDAAPPREAHAASGGATKKELAIEAGTRRPGPFSAPEIREELTARHPDMVFDNSIVSHALRQAADEGVFKVVTPGAGSRPALYENSQARLGLRQKNERADA